MKIFLPIAILHFCCLVHSQDSTGFEGTVDELHNLLKEGATNEGLSDYLGGRLPVISNMKARYRLADGMFSWSMSVRSPKEKASGWALLRIVGNKSVMVASDPVLIPGHAGRWGMLTEAQVERMKNRAEEIKRRPKLLPSEVKTQGAIREQFSIKSFQKRPIVPVKKIRCAKTGVTYTLTGYQLGM